MKSSQKRHPKKGEKQPEKGKKHKKIPAAAGQDDEEEDAEDDDEDEEDYDDESLIESLELTDAGQIARSGGELTHAAAMLSL